MALLGAHSIIQNGCHNGRILNFTKSSNVLGKCGNCKNILHEL